MCQHPGTLLAKRVVEAHEDQILESRGVDVLYLQSWKNCLMRIKQLVQQLSRIGDVQIEKQGPVSGESGESKDAPTSPDLSVFDAGAGPSFV